MLNISNVIKGIDKRMSYNGRLIGTVITDDKPNNPNLINSTSNSNDIIVDKLSNQMITDESEELMPLEDQIDFDEEIRDVLRDVKFNDRISLIVPKLRLMANFTAQKLCLTNEEGDIADPFNQAN
jgi:hypothetical protein